MGAPLLAALNAEGLILSAPITGTGGGGGGTGDAGVGGGASPKYMQPGSALHTSRRPPLITLPCSEGSLSVLLTMSALSCSALSDGCTERISAAAPET